MSNLIDRAATWVLSKVSNTFVFSEYYKRGGGNRIDYKRQAVFMSRKEVEDWTRAIMAATDPDDPRLGNWMRFRQNMKLDGHLMSCIENRILPVQCAPFKLVDKQGNEDTEAKKLLEKPWYLDISKLICSYTFEGVKLIEMFDLDENGELLRVSEIPQSNFIAQKGIVINQESDTNGTSYKEGAYKNYYFQVGGDWDLGIMSGLATIVIAKKLGLGSWMSYIEKFGVPPIFAITDRMDATRRDELFEMLQNFRMNHFAVLQGNEKIETPQGYNVDAHNTFKSLMSDICDKEISKRILGSSGLTDEKSFVGAAEVQERILGYRHKVDKLIFQYYFNTEVKPRLVKLSSVYAPLANLTLAYDESETLSMKELLEAVKGLSQFYEFNIDELVKVTGLPITKLRAITGQPDPEPEKTQKKKTDNSTTSFSLRAPFAYTAPPKAGEGLIYAGTWDNDLDKILSEIEKGKFDPTKLNQGLLEKTYTRLNKAAELGFGNEYYKNDSGSKIRENLLNFSSQKTYTQQKLLLSMRSAFDKIADFHNEAKKYSDRQNGVYLNVQASYVSRRSQFIRQYQEWQTTKETYPNVKFRTMNDKDVRQSHAALEGVIKSKDDPFVIDHATPLDFKCRCWWEETREKADKADPDFTTDPQFAVNPDNIEEIFNDENVYAKELDTKEVRAEVREQKELSKEFMPNNQIIKAGDKNVFVSDFADKKDLAANKNAAQILAKELNRNIYILPHKNIDKMKNPELGIGTKRTKADLKTYGGTSNISNFIQNRIKDASKQGATYAVLDLSKFSGSQSELKGMIRGALTGRNDAIKKVFVINGDAVTTHGRPRSKKK